jgi:hypothetical protein
VHAAPLGPVKPAGHRHADSAVAPVLSVTALAGHAVHELLPAAVLYEPIGQTRPHAIHRNRQRAALVKPVYRPQRTGALAVDALRASRARRARCSPTTTQTHA